MAKVKESCALCGFRFASALQRHRLNPGNNGGSYDPENWICLCANCHCMVKNAIGRFNGRPPSPKEFRKAANLHSKYAQILRQYAQALAARRGSKERAPATL